MKRACTLLFVLLLGVSIAAAQAAPAQPAATRTDVYHVHFTKAALGKAAQLGDFLKTPDPGAAMPGHVLVLRHQNGAEWDYAVIRHLGAKATVDAKGDPPPPAARDASAWHGDTFASGPAWPEFARAMGIADQPSKTANSVYVVSVHRAAPGHRDQLEKVLTGGPGPAGGNAVLLQHLEGGPWNFLAITRHNSYQDFAASESEGLAQIRKNQGNWFAIRDHMTFHTDTITDRIAP